MSGDQYVADNEPVPHATTHGLVPRFVVGYHPGVVTIKIRRQLLEELTSQEAYDFGIELVRQSELSRIPGAA